MKVGIIGVGMVGGALQYGFARIGHEVSVYDIKLPDTKLQDVLGGDILFICVPTPSNPDGSCNTATVEAVVSDVASAGYRGLVAVKSTVEPGTTDKLAQRHPSLRLSFCPEFLRERAMYVDFVENNDICIIGSYRTEDADMLREVHGRLPKQFAYMSPREAELAKYFFNAFNALRIVYANQFYDLCKLTGADYSKIKNAIVKHRNVQDLYLDCNENFRGFGGACLPKDTAALAYYAKKVLPQDNGLSIFEGIVELNKHYKPTVL